MEVIGKKPRELAHLIGFANQGPDSAFVAYSVAEELAFGMEQLGVAAEVMVERVGQIAKSFGLLHLLERPVAELSGGQQQRVAIAAAVAAGQKILLLDEPTSSLDPIAAEGLLSLLKSLSTDLGITVLLVEHRIERVLELVDSVTVVSGDGSALKANRSDGLDPILRNYRMVPPSIELGQVLNWNPLPLTISEARQQWNRNPAAVSKLQRSLGGPTGLDVAAMNVWYGAKQVIRDASFQLPQGSISGIFGPNGSGKTSLLLAIQGALEAEGRVRLQEGLNPRDFSWNELTEHLVMVPQTASDLLLLTSISEELEASDRLAQKPAGTTAKLLTQLAGRLDPARHPRDLSAGQQLALVLSMQLCKGAKALLLDEPTRGMDYQAKRVFKEQLELLKAEDATILVASNDVEFLALVADQVITITDGTVSQPIETTEALASLGSHAPQLLQVTGSALRLEQIEAS
jgi:energy-coupling factor transport system ATP-binding protein